MEWRMVFRRCPSRWMTLVGDPAQTSSPAGVESWSESLAPFIGERFRFHELTVNYRTPKEIMEFADNLLAEIDPTADPAVTVRSTGEPVRRLDASADPEKVRAELDARGGLTAVVTVDNVGEVKGLEFDHVVVVDPDAIVNASPQGWQDLYVAVTRATQTLTLIG